MPKKFIKSFVKKIEKIFIKENFTKIFSPFVEGNPVNPGLYLTDVYYSQTLIRIQKDPKEYLENYKGVIEDALKEYRDDGFWYKIDGTKCVMQQRYWFGLNKEF